MEKLNGKNVLILLLILLFTACQSYKKVPYLQDAEVVLRTNSCMMQRSCPKTC